MPPTRPPYPSKFKNEAVRLCRSGKRLSDVTADLGVVTNTLRAWVRRSEGNTGQREGLTADEREELRRLRREVRVLKEEREIFRKAAASCALEVSSPAPPSSRGGGYPVRPKMMSFNLSTKLT